MPAPMRGAYYTIAEIAALCGKHPATVRKWFTNLAGVIKFPRGKQQPTLMVKEAAARAKLAELGFTGDAIDDFVRDHNCRSAEQERLHLEMEEKRRQARAATTAVPRARGRRLAKPDKKGARRVRKA